MSNNLRFSTREIAILMGLGILAFGCSVDTSAATSKPDEPATDSVDLKYKGVAKVALVLDLPKCNTGHYSSVYYVESTDEFYFCNGQQMVLLDLNGLDGEDGISYLVTTAEADPAFCAAGGTTISVGPDVDGDGVIDVVTSSQSVCNGEKGDPGPQGEQGIQGEQGLPGADGQNGSDGTSCTVRDNLDDTATIICNDGSSATISRGEDSKTGPLLIASEEEPPGENCTSGGKVIHVGYDTDGDEELEESEMVSSAFLCESDGDANSGIGGDEPCIAEGQTGSTLSPVAGCCPGLVMIPFATIIGNGECQLVSDLFVCSNCGDSSYGSGEYGCNCPEDCG